MSENIETILRCLGYSLDFIYTIGPAMGLAAITWRLQK
jgi:hypothetical protein